MAPRTRRVAALAIAGLGCTPIAAPTRPPGQAALEPILDATPPEPAAERIPDASPAEQTGALLLDACPPGPAGALFPDACPSDGPPPSDSIDLAKADAIRKAFVRQLPPRCGSMAFPEAVKAADHRLKGSPADVHTPEGAARGYQVYRHCPNYSSSFQAVAVVHAGHKDMPQARQSVTLFMDFADAARRAAAVPSIHWVTGLPRCFAPVHPLDEAVALMLHDWRQVDQAIRNVGSWLAAGDWNGEVVIWPEPIPEPVCTK
jgi:hypothetical protein